MLSEDDQDRAKYIMTLKNETLSSVSVGWVVKINDFKVTASIDSDPSFMCNSAPQSRPIGKDIGTYHLP